MVTVKNESDVTCQRCRRLMPEPIEDGPDPDRYHDERANGDRDEADARAWADVKNGE